MKKTINLVLTMLFFTTGIMAQKVVENKKANDTLKNSTIDKALIEKQLSVKFYENAKKAGLSEEKILALITIIDERNAVFADLNAKRKLSGLRFAIQDLGALYTYKFGEARDYYAKKIADLINYNQYAYFIIDDYRDQANESANVELKKVVEKKKDLTANQQMKLYELFFNYNINQLLNTAYYSYDKTLQKPKLSSLRFTFEKEFANICKEYNINNSISTGKTSNGFQWN